MNQDQKWQLKYNQQKHVEKILSAKSTLNTGARSGKNNKGEKKDKKAGTKQLSSPTRGSIFDSKTNLSGYTEEEREDLGKIPLYPYLRDRGLQQYTKELVSRGYGYYLDGLCCLDEEDFEVLLKAVKVVPGHSERFRQMRRDLMSDLIVKQRQHIKKSEEEERKQKERKPEERKPQHISRERSGNAKAQSLPRQKHIRGAKVKGTL